MTCNSLIASVYRAQADALLIESRDLARLADEYDQAQERGEVSKGGGRPDCVDDRNAIPATAADLGLRRDEIHEARQIRDAQRADPGVIQRTLDDMDAQEGRTPASANRPSGGA